ncbi:MAG: hypothetical protein ACYTCU_09470 [Planctomycetota bacterium]|jgi:hypothetical protein
MSTDETSPRSDGCAPGSRWESAWLAVLLVADLASIPFHLVVFTLTRGSHKRAFRRALAEAGP